MRKITGLVTAAAIVALAGCATMNVSSHIERDINFTGYVTYDWGPPDNLPLGDPRLDNNPFFNDDDGAARAQRDRADDGDGNGDQ